MEWGVVCAVFWWAAFSEILSVFIASGNIQSIESFAAEVKDEWGLKVRSKRGSFCVFRR